MKKFSKGTKIWYNLRKKVFAGVAMFDEREIAFLFNRCKPISNYDLRRWLNIPEFTDEIVKAKQSGIFVDRRFVLNLMKNVTTEFYERYGEQSMLQRRNYSRVVRRLEQAIEEEDSSKAV